MCESDWRGYSINKLMHTSHDLLWSFLWAFAGASLKRPPHTLQAWSFLWAFRRTCESIQRGYTINKRIPPPSLIISLNICWCFPQTSTLHTSITSVCACVCALKLPPHAPRSPLNVLFTFCWRHTLIHSCCAHLTTSSECYFERFLQMPDPAPHFEHALLLLLNVSLSIYADCPSLTPYLTHECNLCFTDHPQVKARLKLMTLTHFTLLA